jgi:ParB-like chromosome segregation protein Spo0J
MTLQWIPLDALQPHPENSNRMPPHLVSKLKAHIARTGLYEPLIVRPLPADEKPTSAPAQDRFQLLNGHHRAQVLRELGHTHARCDVWLVSDADARLLLATLNRLEGRDDPAARGRLLARLAEGRSAEDLARLLPEPPDAVARLMRLAEPPPAPLDPVSLTPLARPMTFFLSEAQHALVSEALAEIKKRSASPAGHPPLSRSDALERLALWYLESVGMR